MTALYRRVLYHMNRCSCDDVPSYSRNIHRASFVWMWIALADGVGLVVADVFAADVVVAGGGGGGGGPVSSAMDYIVPVSIVWNWNLLPLT